MVPWGIRLAVAAFLPLALSFKLQSDGSVLPLTLTTIGKSARAIADLEQVFDRPDEMHQETMDMISKSLTLPNAIEALQRSALANTSSLKQVTSLLTGKQNLRSSSSLNHGAPGLQSAVNLLNGMIYETATKYDAELAKCSDYYSKQCGLMEAAHGQIAASSFVAATSRALILDASANIAKATTSIPAKELALKQHNAKCKKGIGALDDKLKKVMGDIDSITRVLKSTDCDKKFLQTDKLVLLRCKDQCTNKEYVTFNHKTLQQEVNQLESSLSHDLVMQNFADMFAPLDDDAAPVELVQLAGSEYQDVVSMTNAFEKVDSFRQDDTPAPTRCACENPGHSSFPDCTLSKACSCNGKVRLGYGNKWSPFKNVNGSVQCTSSTFGFDPFPGQAKECQCEATVEKLKLNKPPMPKTKIPSAPPCEDPNGGAPATLNKRGGKCSLTKSPKCYKLQAKFLQIQGKVADERDELIEDIEKLDKSCKETAKTIEASIESDNSNLASAQTKLAEATEKEAGAGENSRQVGIENEEYAADLKKQMNTCSSNYAGYETELCALKKMRGDLFKKFKPGQKPFFQDCELSKWTPEACTKKCAGGEQKLVRSVMTHAEGGAKCLPLTAKKSCNMGPCPVNCVLQSWSSWSKCSSKCGGGVSQRVRDLKQGPKYGGKPCGSSSESRQCNAGACEKDCVLTGWSKWSKCSKDCDGGTMKRQRMVKEPVIGSGKCADKWDPARLQYKECNLKRCEVENPAEVMKCRQALDVVLLLDGALSAGDGQDAWSAEAKAANLLVDAFEGDAKFAVIHYTGPRTWSGVSRCTGKSNAKIDMKNDCRINLAHHLNEDKAQAKDVINGLEFAPGSKLLSLALMMVTSELALGRKNAHAVVVVFIDGQPLSFRKTLLASKAIRKKARLVYVPVAKFAPLKFLKMWASRRWQENLVKVNQAADWAKAETGTHIIANICPKVVYESVTGEALRMSTKHDGKCLDYNYNNKNVYMYNCHDGKNQKWYIDSSGGLRTKHDDNCLDYNYDNGNVYMHKCHDGKNQQWFLKDGHLQTRHNGKCLDYNYDNKNVYMHDCHDGKNQQWYFFKQPEALQLSTKHDGKCLDYNYDNKNVYMHDCHGGKNQKWYIDNTGGLKTKHDDNCLDYDYNKGNVYMHKCHDGKNQRWFFKDGHLQTRHDGKCLDYNYDNKNVYMHDCHNGKNQQWYFKIAL